MENGIAIDTLHAQLLDLSRNDEYGFEELRCQDWGKANSEKYNKLKSNFDRSMRRLAKKAPVKISRPGIRVKGLCTIVRSAPAAMTAVAPSSTR